MKLGSTVEMTSLKHSKKFFFRIDPKPIWNKTTRTLQVSGWCVARDGSAVTAIRARVPEIFEAPLDRERPEVVTHLNGASCGFVLDLKVPKQPARLAFDAADKNGNWHQIFFTTIDGATIAGLDDPGYWQELNAPMRYGFHFDHPRSWSEPRRVLYVAGWCVDRTGEKICAIRARAGSQEFPANYGIERSDVAEYLPNVPAAGHSGFSIAIPVPKQPNKLKFELQNEAGEWQQFHTEPIPGRSKTATPEQLFAPPDVEFLVPGTTKKSRFRFWFDLPRDWSKKIRYMRVSGWCVAMSGEPIDEVRARIGKKTVPGRYRIRRPDVARAVGKADALSCGLSIDVIVPRRPVTLVLEARVKDGIWESFFEHRVCAPIFAEESEINAEEGGDYAAWIRKYDRLTSEDRRHIRNHIAQFRKRPLISVLMPTYNSDLTWLRRAIESVRAQLYPNWELCVADDASSEKRVWTILQAFARRDPRIKIVRREKNGGIAAASNDALHLATGDYIALLDHDDELAPTALYFVALELNRDPLLQLLYSDEDKLDRSGRRRAPHFKPDWSPDLFLSQNYISHLGVYDAQQVRQLGGFREGFEGAQDYDLTLRCIERTDPARIRHIPRVLYHWRAADASTAAFADAKPEAQQSSLRAVQEHLARRGIAATVEPHRTIYQRVKYKLPEELPLVSVIIPTRDRVALLRTCVQSILEKTDYPNLEVIIIDNESRELETRVYLDSLGEDERVTVYEVGGEFNYSKLNNFGVKQARGSLVALLNNDVEVIEGDWLREMVGQSLRLEVGAVGALLRYPDKTFQHGGVILGAGGIAGHAHSGTLWEEGYFSRPHLTQNLSAITAACALIKRDAYLEVGGFDEVNVPVAFNDVDFCLRLRAAGHQIVWTPHAELFHHESASRGSEDTLEKQTRFLSEVEYMRNKWGATLQSDPFYNPNLSLGENLFVPAFPPRVIKPWIGK